MREVRNLWRFHILIPNVPDRWHYPISNCNDVLKNLAFPKRKNYYGVFRTKKEWMEK